MPSRGKKPRSLMTRKEIDEEERREASKDGPLRRKTTWENLIGGPRHLIAKEFMTALGNADSEHRYMRQLRETGNEVLREKDLIYLRTRRRIKWLFLFVVAIEDTIAFLSFIALVIAYFVTQQSVATDEYQCILDRSYPKCAFSVHQEEEGGLWWFKIALTCISIFTALLNFIRHVVTSEIRVLRFIDPSISKCSNIFVSPLRNFSFLFETFVFLFHVPLGINHSIPLTEVSAFGSTKYLMPINNLNVALIFRQLSILWVMRNHSGYATQKIANIGALNGVDSTALFFSFRMFFRERPLMMIVCSLVSMITYTSITMIMVERFSPSSQLKTWPDVLWCVVVSISTVGYGDLYPATFAGRVVISIFAVLLGTLLMTAVTAIFIMATDLNPRQQRVCRAVDQDMWLRRFKHYFSIALQRALRRHWLRMRTRGRCEKRSLDDDDGGAREDPRMALLKYRYRSAEWIPGLVALVEKQLCTATAHLRRQRHMCPPEVSTNATQLNPPPHLRPRRTCTPPRERAALTSRDPLTSPASIYLSLSPLSSYTGGHRPHARVYFVHRPELGRPSQQSGRAGAVAEAQAGADTGRYEANCRAAGTAIHGG